MVWRRSARRQLHGAAKGRGRGQDHGAAVVGERRGAGSSAGDQPDRRQAGLWRHACGFLGGAGNSGDQGARAAGDVLSVPDDGRAAGKYAAEPIFRQRSRDRTGCVAVAGKDNVFTCGGFCGIGRQDRARRHTGRSVFRHGHPVQLRNLRHHGHMDRRHGLGSSPDDPALCPPLCGSRRGRRFPDRLGNDRSDHDPERCQHLSGCHRAQGAGGGRACHSRGRHQDRLCGRLVGILRPPSDRRKW